MNNLILSGDRISHIDEELTKISVVRHASSAIWKRVSAALKVTFSRPFKADSEVMTYLLVILPVLFSTIFIFLIVLG